MTPTQVNQLASAVKWGHMTLAAALVKADAAGAGKALRRVLHIS